MNVLQINNNHFIIGGAATYYFNVAELLERQGHKCIFYSMHSPKNFPCKTSDYFMPFVDLNAEYSLLNQIKIAGRILYSFEARRRLSKLLEKYRVDIAHLHNIYHAISPSILHELKERRIPIVMTIHDSKLVCGSYILFKRGQIHGEVCEACSGGRYYKIAKNKCVKNSLKKSLLTALEMYLHHKVFNIYDNVDVFTTPSLFLKNKFREMGFKREIIHLPYFIDINKYKKIDEMIKGSRIQRGNYIIYGGRLAVEKGLWTLLDAVKLLSHGRKNFEVRVAGEGPMKDLLLDKVRKERIENVKFLGFLKSEDLFQEMRSCVAMVQPSECYDNFPMAIIEAFLMEIPVIGSRIGGIPEIVKDNETGLTFGPRNAHELAEKMEYMLDNHDKAEIMGRNAKVFVKEELNAEKHYQKLMEVYTLAMRGRF